ncbi:MAG: hypothetical protein JSR82_17135 [Verrucomicrobia bacterium]|nr:hypothetical protein [Verrucomicrobiota bacterium]
MNIDAIFSAMNAEGADYLLIGGMNFLLLHRPDLTFDVDLWVRDDASNLASVNRGLRRLGAEWGRTEATWGPVPEDPQWLSRQSVYCLTTSSGALDIMREVKGLEGRYTECRQRSLERQTPAGTPFRALAVRDMLACQEALRPEERKAARVEFLRLALEKEGST